MEVFIQQLALGLNGAVQNIANDIKIKRTHCFKWLMKMFKESVDTSLKKLGIESAYVLVPCIPPEQIVKRDVLDVLMLFTVIPKRDVLEQVFEKCKNQMRFTGGKIGKAKRGRKVEKWPKSSLKDGVLVFEFSRPNAFTIKIQVGVTPPPGNPDPLQYVEHNALFVKYHRSKLEMTPVAASAFRLVRYLKSHNITPWCMVDNWVLKLLSRNCSLDANNLAEVIARMILFFWNVQEEHEVQDDFNQQRLNVIRQEDVVAASAKAEGYMTNVNLLQLEYANEGPVPFEVDLALLPDFHLIQNVDDILHLADVHPAVVVAAP